MKKLGLLTALLAVALLALSGCAAAPWIVASAEEAPSRETPIVAPPPAKPTLESTIAPPAAEPGGAKPTAPAAGASQVSEDADGWQTYRNGDYGFRLRYPEGWALAERPAEGRFSPSVKLTRDTYSLILGFKRAGEDLIIEAGMPAGDLVYRGKVTVFGNAVQRQVLVFEGKDKAVSYNGSTPIEIGELQILIALQDLATSDYDAVAIPQDVQDQADLIVASLEAS